MFLSDLQALVILPSGHLSILDLQLECNSSLSRDKKIKQTNKQGVPTVA